ncbi:hypothetical protein ACFRDV_40585 [Streptomyces fagopyri]
MPTVLRYVTRKAAGWLLMIVVATNAYCATWSRTHEVALGSRCGRAAAP